MLGAGLENRKLRAHKVHCPLLRSRSSGPCFCISPARRSFKCFYIREGVYILALAELAADYERVRRIRLLGFELVLETRHPCGNDNWFSTPNTSHATIALH
jgi:hypothetical protein